MALRKIGATLELDGEKEFKKGMSDAARQLRVLDSEVKANTASFGKNEKSLESLTKKGQLFEQKVAQQKEIVKALAKAVDESADKYGEASEKTDGYRIKLNNATASLAKMERELEQNSRDMEEFGRDTENTASKMDRFKAKAKEMGASLKDMGDKLKGIGTTMSAAVTAPIVAAGVASFKMAADLEDAMGATDQIFKNAANSVKKWADELESYYGIAEGEALEYANMMGSMLVNIGGLTEEQAAKQAATLIELAGDLTAMYGGTTADAVRALTGALKGNNTMLDNYGMAANDAMVKTKALEMGLYDGTGQMDLATKQAATLALIMEQSAAAQGQAAREADGASGSMRALATEMKNIAGDIGGILLPMLTPLIAKLQELVTKFSEMSPAGQKMVVIIAGIAAAIGPLLVVIGSLMTLLPVLAAGIGAISLPVVAVIAGIAALGAAIVWIYNLWKENGEKSKAILRDLEESVRRGLDKITGFFRNLKLPEIKIPKIKMPHFSIQGSFSLNPPKVPSFGVNWYQKGGIFDRPSIIGVGEAGTEIVAPLAKLEKILANSLASFDTPGGNSQVYVNVNTPVYLDGQIITRSTSRHQYGRNKSFSRAVGVTV